jgi:hypothetical protein
MLSYITMERGIDNLKNFGKEVVSEQEQSIFSDDDNNKYLTTNILNLGNLRIYLNLKFTSLRIAGREAGLSYARMRQLVTGKYLPSKPELIKQISEAWAVDSIKLTQLFERMREEKR